MRQRPIHFLADPTVLSVNQIFDGEPGGAHHGFQIAEHIILIGGCLAAGGRALQLAIR